MKKTNIVLGIVIAIFFVCAIAILVIAWGNNKEEDTVPVNIDLSELSSEIEEITNFNSATMEKITTEDLEENFNIHSDWVKQVIGVKPYVNVSSSMYVIIEVTEGNVDNVMSALKEYGKSYDELWKDYLTEEYELVKNRQIGAKGNYVYFIVSDYAKDIVDLIK